VTADLPSIRRFVGWSLVVGLTVAAGAAMVALANANFNETDTRVFVSSLGFTIFGATGAAGARAESEARGALRALGLATIACSVVAFALLVVGLWTLDWEGSHDGFWRTFGCTAVAGIAGAHACVVLLARRSTDSDTVRLLASAAVCLGAFDALGVILPLSGLADDVGETWARVFAAALVLLILTSVLPPLLRRLQAPHSPEKPPEYVLEGA
jgi:hypothetical protein